MPLLRRGWSFLLNMGVVSVALVVPALAAYGARAAWRDSRRMVPAAAYQRPRIRAGRELIVALIAGSGCHWSEQPELQTAFRELVRIVEARARREGIPTVSIVGVAVDWQPAAGLAFLDGVGAFDELIVGRSWLNTGIDRYVRHTGQPYELPQVVVLERTLVLSPAHPAELGASDEKVVVSLSGTTSIVAWVAQGGRFDLAHGEAGRAKTAAEVPVRKAVAGATAQPMQGRQTLTGETS